MRGRTIILCLVAVAAVAMCIVYVLGVIPYRLEIVHTGSMDPHIPSGSAVVVHESKYQTDQPVTFVINGETVTHRLVAVNADGTITTKGDANPSDDPWHAPVGNVVGGAVASIKYLGFVLYFVFRTPTGLLSIVMMFWGLSQVGAISRILTTSPRSN